jgi:hypothetical protein
MKRTASMPEQGGLMADNSGVCPVCGRGATRDASSPYAVTTVSCPSQCGVFRVATGFLPELADARAGIGLLATRLDDVSRALQARVVTQLRDMNQVLDALDDFVDAETTTE